MSRYDLALGRPVITKPKPIMPQKKHVVKNEELDFGGDIVHLHRPTHRTIAGMFNAILKRGYQNVLCADDPSIPALGYSCWNVIDGEEYADYFTAPLRNGREFTRRYPLLNFGSTAHARAQLAQALAGSPYRSFKEFYSHLDTPY